MRSLLILMLSMLWFACSQESEPKDIFTQNLDGEWLIKQDSSNIGVSEKWYRVDLNRSDWNTGKVPGVIGDYGYDSYDGKVWFHRTFDYTGPMDKVALVFDGVDDNALVYLNGDSLGYHIGWGRKFAFDISGKLKKGENAVTVELEDIAGPGGITRSVSIQTFNEFDELRYGPYADSVAAKAPEWLNEGIIYEVFVRNYSPSGTFKGVEADLDRLERLGVKVLWFMPIHPIGEEKKKGTIGSPYAIQDFYKIHDDLGTPEDFKSLVNAAHAKDMVVIIDLVINHTSWDSELIKTHPEWFKRNESGEIIPPVADWWDIAALDYSNQGLRDYMKELLVYWVEEYDIDGYRCDVAEVIPEDFWKDAIAEVQKVKPTFWLAEGAAASLHMAGFHATYAFNIYDYLDPVFNDNKGAGLLKKGFESERYEYPKNAIRMLFTENHDKQPQLKIFTEDQSKVAAFMTYTVPGIPLLYNGMEVGNKTRIDLFEKMDINWGDRPTSHPFHQFYEKLYQLRKQYPFLKDGKFDLLESGDFNILAYSRYDEANPSQKLNFLLNFSDQTVTVKADWTGKGEFNGLEIKPNGDVELGGFQFDYWVE